MCSALESAVEVHVRHFHRQQAAERVFLSKLPELCQAAPEAYYAKLHALRKCASEDAMQ